MAESRLKVYLDNERPAPPGWQLARTIEQAQAFIRSGRVDQLSLDYDLDGDHKGLELLEWMKRDNRWPAFAPKVHSGNVQGAQEMKRYIKQHSDLPAAPPARRGRPPKAGHYSRAHQSPAKY